MTTSVYSDKRSEKAEQIALGAADWQEGRTRDGRRFYAIPSQCEPGLFHMTTVYGCSCRDFQRRLDGQQPCKHMAAVRLAVSRGQVKAHSTRVPLVGRLAV